MVRLKKAKLFQAFFHFLRKLECHRYHFYCFLSELHEFFEVVGFFALHSQQKDFPFSITLMPLVVNGFISKPTSGVWGLPLADLGCFSDEFSICLTEIIISHDEFSVCYQKIYISFREFYICF